MTKKLVSVIEMTLLYAARYSFVLLRPKNKIKLSTQSAHKWICMGKWPVPSLAEFVNHVLVVPYVPEFFPRRGRFPSSGKINSGTQWTRGRGLKKSKTRI